MMKYIVHAVALLITLLGATTPSHAFSTWPRAKAVSRRSKRFMAPLYDPQQQQQREGPQDPSWSSEMPSSSTQQGSFPFRYEPVSHEQHHHHQQQLQRQEQVASSATTTSKEPAVTGKVFQESQSFVPPEQQPILDRLSDAGLNLQQFHENLQNFAMPRSIQEFPSLASAQSQLQEWKTQTQEWTKGDQPLAILQALLGLAIVLGEDHLPFLGPLVHAVLGPLLLLGGLGLAVQTYRDTPDPPQSPAAFASWMAAPKEDARDLITRGVYGHVRHPLFASLVAAGFGVALITDSMVRLGLVAALWYVLDRQAAKEEAAWLDASSNPSDAARYQAYQQAVPHQYLPTLEVWQEQLQELVEHLPPVPTLKP